MLVGHLTHITHHHHHDDEHKRSRQNSNVNADHEHTQVQNAHQKDLNQTIQPLQPEAANLIVEANTVGEKENKHEPLRKGKEMTAKQRFVFWWKNLPSVKYQNHSGKKTEYDARSLFILKGEWKIRRWICWLIEWKYFDQFITTVILMNSVMLACNDYNDRLYGADYVSTKNLNMGVVDTAFSIIFLCECILKIVGMGLFMHKKAYLRDTWNWLDFFVVTVSVICWMPGVEGNKSLKSLRTFRILRPLRSINSMPAMKAQIKILLASIKGLVNVIIFLMFVYCIFAIFGAHQFSGETYSRCRVTEVPVLVDNTTSPPTFEWLINQDFNWLCNEDDDCAQWVQPGQVAKCGALLQYSLPLSQDKNWQNAEIWYDIINFNNVPIAMITIFQCLTLENWTLVMYNYMDCNSTGISIFFFCFLTIFGSWFSMQLVLATIMDSFAREQMEKKFEQLDDSNDKEQAMELAKNFANLATKLAEAGQAAQEELNVHAVEVNLPQSNQPEQENLQVQTLVIVESQDKKDDLLDKKMPLKIPDEFQDRVDTEEEYENEAEYEKASRLRAQKNMLLGCVYLFCTNPIYNLTVFILILGNTAVLAIDDYPQSLQKEALLRQLNVFFTFAFVAEMLIKILGLGINNYVKDKFNLFDCFVVMLSLIDYTITNTLTVEQLAQMGSGLQAIRALRLLRILKLARSWTKLQDILRKTIGSVKDIVNFGVLLALYLYIYALLGMEMFAFNVLYDEQDNVIVDVPATIAAGGVALAPRLNYNNVFRGLVTGFFLILFEDWPSTWYNFIRPSINQQDGSVGFDYYLIIFYFLSNQIFGGIIMLSLFTAILLQNFEPTDEEIVIIRQKKEAAKLAPKFTVKSVFTKKTLTKFHALFMNVFGGPSKKQKQEEQSAVVPEGQPEIKIEDFSTDDKKKQNQDEVVKPKPDLPNSMSDNLKKGIQKTILSKSFMFHYQLLDQKKAAIAVKTEDLTITGKSLFIFSPENKIRIYMNILILHPFFDNFILALILISTVTLAFDSPLTDPLGMQATILTYIDYIMSSFFYCECISKIIALGFAACGKTSYIRNPWNILDFTIVSSALISMVFSGVNLKSLKTLRVLRVLRPLRLLNKNRGLKLAIQSLFNSIPNIVNLLFVMWFFMFLMSILGMTFFNGSMWICVADHLSLSYQQQLYYIQTRQDCINYGGEWQLPWMHFDNLIQSFLSLISMQSTENWIVITMQMTDAVGEELQPIRENNIFQLGFGIAVMVVLYMLFLNLFVGVVIESFNNEKEELSLNSLLRQIEKKWIDVQLMTYNTKPEVKINTTGQRFVDLMIRISQNPKFDLFIMIMILANTFLLAMKWYNQSEQTLMGIEYLNYIFSAIFTVEAIIKLAALGKKYFKETWNIFDFIVVVGTWVVQLILKLDLGIDLKILGTLLRTLRIGRIFRIVKRVKAISMIFQTLIDAIPAISSVAVLLLLLMFMYTIIGIGQFGNVMFGDLIDPHVNFTIYWKGMLMLMRCSTGEAWDELMMNYAQTFSITYQCNYNSDFYSIQANNMQPDGCGNPVIAYIYFYSYLIIVSQIFLNLIIAIIIDSFLGQSDAFNLPINQNDVSEYKEVWKDFDPDARGYIDAHDLEDFIISLCYKQTSLIPNRMLVAKDVTFRRRYIAKLEIPAFDQFRKFLFHDVVQTMARSVCEKAYNRERLSEKKLAVKQQKMLIKEKEKMGELTGEIQIVFDKEFELEFHEVVNGIPKLNNQIDALVQLKAVASKIGGASQKHGKLDLNEDGDVTDVYTSKHFVYGTLIVSCWREYIRLMKIEEKMMRQQQEQM